MQKFLDFHSHFRKFSADETAIVSIFPDESPCENRSGIFYSCGIHPEFIRTEDSDYSDQLQIIRMRMNDKNFVAVGECGIDRTTSVSVSRQMEIFEKQIEIACEFRKPVIIHCVRAYSEILFFKKNSAGEKIHFIIHGFCGSAKLAEQLAEKNIILSFGYRSLLNKKNIDSLIAVREKGFFLESDGVKEGVKPIYERVAGILKIDIEELKNKILDLAETLSISVR